ncbi:hypothetical protein HY449_01830 [Candidatus Pacearchaeota archaeon]|nr:hypothetical protein [Candidatus Pacearchaeota archaeon]
MFGNFGKRECKRCGENSSNKHNFCPNCGVPFNNKKTKRNDFGMLGESDFDEAGEFQNPFFGGLAGGMINKMFESAVKMFEKEMEREMKRGMQNPRTNFQLFINGKPVKFENAPGQRNFEGRRAEIQNSALPKNNLKDFPSLPKKEPTTEVRRFSNKLIYEINLPGVKSDKDISIVKLENSIEIKAVAGDSAYKKIIPINLPVTNYNLSNGKLVLELGE